MVSERIKNTAEAMNRIASYFTYNRDAAYVLLAAGVEIAIVSIIAIILSIQGGTFNTTLIYVQEIGAGILPALVEIVIAALMVKNDSKHFSLGFLALIVGLISLPGTEGGLFIGFILVLIASVMSMLFRGPFRSEIPKGNSE